ncbi:LuxR C-terminal-related transcriptional regulator [Mycolicibacterium sp.]|uniref:LuxR C-terminal-related transcriptional regulator n=1 Tax=Mycolicibacterium sp. TaxID=2320850 RepID=UPI001A2EC5CD|nr:LuxR C-terminal-related transcriptional regulator [Mycolicibacterium sp.]MBJ7337554.1 hypothetical protein [Mycolicibacterium sp.]
MVPPRDSLGSGDAGCVAATPTGSRSAAAKDALARLRTYSNNADLAERIPIELCQAGFGRVLFSRIEHNMWVVRSAHSTQDPGMADALLQVGRAHPKRLCAPLPESAMVRTKKPILVEGPQSDPRVNSDLVAVVQPDVYVAAPIYVWQTPVGLLHADAPSDAGDVNLDDRDLLGVFAEAVGAILERNVALERMKAMQRSARTHLHDIRSLTSEFEGNWQRDEEAFTSFDQSDDVLRELVGEQMTRREQQVLQLLAAGKTNAQIADRLFVSEGTVKSHVRHIMQKLDASNRTDAVSRYQQMGKDAAERTGYVPDDSNVAHIPPLPQKH